MSDHTGQKVRIVRVKYHNRGTPDRIGDVLYEFRNGELAAGIGMDPNRFGDDWRAAAAGLDWEKANKKQ